MNWPLVEAVYGSYQWLLREVADAMGIGPDSSAWTYEEFSRVDAIVQRGVRAFNLPPPLPNERRAHEWSFLRPTTVIETAADQATYDLPAGFAMFDGPMVYKPDQNSATNEVELTSEYKLQKLRVSKAKGPPSCAAVRPKAHDPTVGTRYEITFYPEPDDVYELLVPMQVKPVPLTESDNMPYGGDVHADAIRAACIATAMPGDGAAMAAYLERLVPSVMHDRKVTAPEALGTDYDRSDRVVETGLRRTGFPLVEYRP